MNIGKILYSFNDFRGAIMVDFARGIIESMKDNSNFTTLTAQVTEVENAYNTFVDTIPSANQKNKDNTAAMEANRIILVKKLTALGLMVEAVAEGNVAVLQTSGFMLQAKRTSRPIPATPTEARVALTNDLGVLQVSCDRDKNATTYFARVSLDKENWAWYNFGTASKVLVSGIPTGVSVFAQIQLRNSAGHSGWTNPVEVRLPGPGEPMVSRVNVSMD